MHLSGSAEALAADWPKFGGPTMRRSTEAKVPAELVNRWSVFISAVQHGEATVVGERVFMGSSDGQFWCLDLKTGRPLWKVNLPGGPRASAPIHNVCHQGTVYFSSGSHVW